MQTRSRHRNPPDWNNLDSNTVIQLREMARSLGISPPEDASRIELKELVIRHSSPKSKPYKYMLKDIDTNSLPKIEDLVTDQILDSLSDDDDDAYGVELNDELNEPYEIRTVQNFEEENHENDSSRSVLFPKVLNDDFSDDNLPYEAHPPAEEILGIKLNKIHEDPARNKEFSQKPIQSPHTDKYKIKNITKKTPKPKKGSYEIPKSIPPKKTISQFQIGISMVIISLIFYIGLVLTQHKSLDSKQVRVPSYKEIIESSEFHDVSKKSYDAVYEISKKVCSEENHAPRGIDYWREIYPDLNLSLLRIKSFNINIEDNFLVCAITTKPAALNTNIEPCILIVVVATVVFTINTFLSNK